MGSSLSSHQLFNPNMKMKMKSWTGIGGNLFIPDIPLPSLHFQGRGDWSAERGKMSSTLRWGAAREACLHSHGSCPPQLWLELEMTDGTEHQRCLLHDQQSKNKGS